MPEVTLPHDLIAALAKSARERGLTMTEVLRDAIRISPSPPAKKPEPPEPRHLCYDTGDDRPICGAKYEGRTLMMADCGRDIHQQDYRLGRRGQYCAACIAALPLLVPAKRVRTAMELERVLGLALEQWALFDKELVDVDYLDLWRAMKSVWEAFQALEKSGGGP